MVEEDDNQCRFRIDGLKDNDGISESKRKDNDGINETKRKSGKRQNLKNKDILKHCTLKTQLYML